MLRESNCSSRATNYGTKVHSDKAVWQARAATFVCCAIVIHIHASLPETTSFAVLCCKVADGTLLFLPVDSLHIGYGRQGFSLFAYHIGIWLSRSPKELPQPTGFAMQMTNSEFIWAISIATFLAVVLIFILGVHIISTLRLSWKPGKGQERSADGTGNGA